MGFAKAAAALTAGAAPRVTDTFDNAANATAGYARGLGDAVQAPVDQAIAAHNAFLTQTGAPGSALEHSAPIGNTAYGLEGYIPASTLQHEGAAFRAAAEILPADVLGRGQQAATAALNDNTNIAKLQASLADIAAKQPELYQSILGHMQDQAYRGAELNLRSQSLASENAYRSAELGQSAERIRLEAGRMAQTTLNEDRSYALSLSRLGIENKRLQLEATKQEISLRNGGLSPAEISRYHSIAFGLATQAFQSEDKNTGKPITFQEALATITEKGVPPSMAMQALETAGFHPGVRGTPRALSPAAGNGASIFDNLGGTLGAPFGAAAGGIETAAAHTIVNLAHEYLGTPYVWGGSTPKGFDCSGFAQFLYAKVGIKIPRTTYDQWGAGRPVGKGQLQPGDLVFFRGSDSRGGLPGHVGVYIGHGQMIDEPHTGSSAQVANLAGFPGYMGARRYG